MKGNEELLRGVAVDAPIGVLGPHYHDVHDAVVWAVAEIDRLRAENEHLRSVNADARAKTHDLLSDNAALRSLGDELANQLEYTAYCGCGGLPVDGGSHEEGCLVFRWLALTAP